MLRRDVLKLAIGLAASPIVFSSAHAATSKASISAYRDPGCGCCEQWAEILKAAGFAVSIEDDPDLVGRRKIAGVPEDLAGCHFAVMGNYIIDGHVPVQEIERLLSEKPDIKGIAVPGMPIGSPGMEMGETREAYDVIAFKADGTRKVFASYAAG